MRSALGGWCCSFLINLTVQLAERCRCHFVSSSLTSYLVRPSERGINEADNCCFTADWVWWHAPAQQGLDEHCSCPSGGWPTAADEVVQCNKQRQEVTRAALGDVSRAYMLIKSQRYLTGTLLRLVHRIVQREVLVGQEVAASITPSALIGWRQLIRVLQFFSWQHRKPSSWNQQLLLQVDQSGWRRTRSHWLKHSVFNTR